MFRANFLTDLQSYVNLNIFVEIKSIMNKSLFLLKYSVHMFSNLLYNNKSNNDKNDKHM